MKTEEKAITFFFLGLVLFMVLLAPGFRGGAKMVPLVIGAATGTLLVLIAAIS